MTIAAVGFDLLGLFRAELSGPAAVGWNLAYIVGALGGRAPCGPFEKPGSKNSSTAQSIKADNFLFDRRVCACVYEFKQKSNMKNSDKIGAKANCSSSNQKYIKPTNH